MGRAKESPALSELERYVEEPDLIDINKVIVSANKNTKSKENALEIKTAMEKLEATAKYSSKNTNESSNQSVIIKFFNIGKIVDKLEEIINITNRKSLYIFIDDYSELNREDRTICFVAIMNARCLFNRGTVNTAK